MKLYQKSNLRAKVKSLTDDNEKAITRAFVYRHKGSDELLLNITVLFFSKNDDEDDELVRVVGNRYLYRRETPIKSSTLRELLVQLGFI